MSNGIIKGLGFHHIALKVKDFERSLDFYKNGLGLRPVVAWGEGDKRIQMLDLGDGGILELFAGGSELPAESAKWIHFAMHADDVEAAYATAVAAGGEPLTPPKTVPLDSTPYKMTIQVAFVKGFDGEELEFFRVVSKED